jgi:hypothetical protein
VSSVPPGGGATLAFEPVEGPVPGRAEQPAPERGRLTEVVDALPRGEEGVLGDLRGDLAVSDDVPGDVPHPVEPAVEEDAERVGVAGAGGQDQIGVVPFLCHPAPASPSPTIVNR